MDEIRYLKRQNLEEEAKITGNYFRDCIRQYGIDCNYYKLKIPYLEVFKPILDDNNLISHAYGQDSNPDYSISSNMITFMTVEDDILQLNKYGVIPDMNVTFYFNSTDFACSLAYKLGQLKEYKIEEQDFEIEVPECISDYVEYDIDEDGRIVTYDKRKKKVFEKNIGYTMSSYYTLSSYDAETHELMEVKDLTQDEFKSMNIRQERMYLSDDVFPYGIGYGFPEFYRSDILSGRFAVKIGPYEMDKEYTVRCTPYEHGDIDISFPVNDTIYKSFNHVIDTKEYVDQVLFLTYKVTKVKIGRGYKNILKGKLHGAILFHDLSKVGKYVEMIHPEVGDVITIDFPDENNRQQFEITECNDKNLASDGINPLLHRYIWKCKARRYINSGEDFPEKNEANERLEEKLDFLNNTDEILDKQIGRYDEKNNDAVYGGYEREIEPYDKRKVDILDENTKFEFIDDGSYIELHIFGNGCKLVTDGYELFFIDSNNQSSKLTLVEREHIINENLVASGIQYLKASDNELFFMNFDNKIQKIAFSDDLKYDEVEICLNSLLDTTYSNGSNNKEGDFFYKFRETNTVLMALENHLYCRFANKKHNLVKIC